MPTCRSGARFGYTDDVIRVVVVSGLLVAMLNGCSSDDASACDDLRDRLDVIEAEAAALGEQSFENVVRVQELQTERTSVRREMAEQDCDEDT